MALDTVTAIGQYPLIRVGGSARDRGLQYGRLTRDRVHKTLAAYSDLFLAYAGLRWPEVREFAIRFTSVIEAYDRELMAEMEGIAEGAAVDMTDVLAINVRTEIMFGLGEIRAAADCTAFAALPSATSNEHTLLGQNWDWHPAAFDCCVVLAIEQDDRPSIVTVVEAGLLAKMGMNSSGVGVATNALVADVDKGEPGIPYHVLLRTILNCRSLDEARSRVSTTGRASSANYLLAFQDGNAVDLEVAPGAEDRVFSIEPQDGVLGHANCFVAPTVSVVDQTPEKKPLSMTRQRTINRRLRDHAGNISVELMKTILADHENHPNALCRHPLEYLAPVDRSATVASVIMDLDERTLWVADGQPCSHPYHQFSAADLWPRKAEATEPTRPIES